MIKDEILAAAKPILFNTEMVRAILEGRKTVTRRVCREIGIFEEPISDSVDAARRTFGVAGVNPDSGERQYMAERPCRLVPSGLLYVRETWCPYATIDSFLTDTNLYAYKADFSVDKVSWKWRPSIHMPKEAARLFLRATEVRVERLQDITEEGLHSEGVESEAFEAGCAFAKGIFHGIWNSTIKPADLPRCGWDANPWVWVIKFKKMEVK